MYLYNIAFRYVLLIVFGYVIYSGTLQAQTKSAADKQGGAAFIGGKSNAGYSIFYKTLADLTWPEIKKASDDNSLVLLPVGVIEEHGPHNCLGTDTYLAYQRSLELQQKLESRNIRAVIAPPFYWGIMQLNETGAFPGSFTVSPATMKMLLADIFEDLHRWGFRNIYCVNHHGDRIHRKSLSDAISEAKEKFGLNFYNDQESADRDSCPDAAEYVSGKLYEPDYHSGASETSAMLSYYPELVKADTVKILSPENNFFPLGYVGDPSNYRKINMYAIDKMEVNYYAERIVSWLHNIK